MIRLLSESYLNSLPDPIAKNMEALNQYVVERICKRIQQIGVKSETIEADKQNIQQLRQENQQQLNSPEEVASRTEKANQYADTDIREIEKELEKSNKDNKKEAEKMYLLLAAEVLAFSAAFYKAKGKEPPEGGPREIRPHPTGKSRNSREAGCIVHPASRLLCYLPLSP